MMPYKVLVVDDEDSIRTLLKITLSQEGRTVVTAACGKEAIAMFQTTRPNLTILDIDMPDIDGIAVLRQIRAIDPHARVMIFTGGGSSPSVEREARALGVTDFLHKGLALPPLAELQSRGSLPASPQGTPLPIRSGLVREV